MIYQKINFKDKIASTRGNICKRKSNSQLTGNLKAQSEEKFVKLYKTIQKSS